MFDKVQPYAKAVVAGVVAFGGAYGTAYADGTVASAEWVGIAVATVVAAGGVFLVPNKDPQALHQSESTQPPGA